MGQNGKQIREKMFDVYAANLTEMEHDTHDIFRCPTCLRDFNRSALEVMPGKTKPELTIGHIIPEPIKSRKFTLQCATCNSNFGSAFDAHIDNWRKFLDWVGREAGTHWPTRLTIEEISASAYTTWDGKDSGSITTAAKKGIDPNYQDLMRKIQEQYQRLGKIEVTMNMRVRSVPKMRVLSTVHSAFLMMFYCFGYEYALSPEADIVRKIIHEEQGSWDIGKMISYTSNVANFSIPSAGVIRKPIKIKSFVVVLPCPYMDSHAQMVILPGFSGMTTYKNYLNKRHKKAKNIGINITYTSGGPNDAPSPRGLCRALWSGEVSPLVCISSMPALLGQLPP